MMKKRVREGFVLMFLALLLVLAIVASTSLGAVKVSLAHTARILWSHLWPFAVSIPSETADAIIWSVRLPRVILAVMVGGALAVSGTVFQGLLRNPMADPYILGISAGASLGAALAMTLATRTGSFSLGPIPLFAFAGAILTVAMVYRLGRVRGQLSILTLLLAGVAVSTVLSSVVSFLVYFSGDKFQPLIYWLMGGLGGRGWDAVLTTLPYLAIGTGVALLYSRHLNALSLGDEAAHHLGVPVARVRLILVAAGSLLAAAAVSAGGIIGFVGLLVPHILRLIIGGDHRLLTPASLLAGGTFLTLADTIARTLMAPTELPVGIVTALFGGPVFLYLLRRKVS